MRYAERVEYVCISSTSFNDKLKVFAGFIRLPQLEKQDCKAVPRRKRLGLGRNNLFVTLGRFGRSARTMQSYRLI
jgi:hypothetical protein